MLRGLILVLMVLNVALFFWWRDDPDWTRDQREPARLAQQIAPRLIQAVPDTPARPASAPSAAAR